MDQPTTDRIKHVLYSEILYLFHSGKYFLYSCSREPFTQCHIFHGHIDAY